MPQIVTVNVNLQQAPTPPTLQKTGALVSQGGTILASTDNSLLTQLSDITDLLVDARNLSSLTWAAGVATATTASPHGLTISDVVELTIAGVTPAGYNGTYPCTITGASTFTYAVPVSPGGSASVHGAYSPADVAELNAMATTFFSQGVAQAVYVFETGPVDDDDAIAVLADYITANPNSDYMPGLSGYFYGYLVPRSWARNPNFLALVAQYEGTTARTYFWTTTTLDEYPLLTDLMKDVISEVEAPQWGAWPQNQVTSATRESAASAAALVAAGTGYAPNDTYVPAGGTDTVPATLRIATTKAVSATIVSGGTTAHANGAAQVIGTTGTGTMFTLDVTITSGTISAVVDVAAAGSYTVNPTAPATEPVSGVSFTITGAVVDVVMGVETAVVPYGGAYTVNPTNPVSQASTSGLGTGATFNLTMVSNLVVVAGTTSAHGVVPGDWFQLQGFTPAGYNGWHEALPGTATTTLVFGVLSDPGAESALGTLEASSFASAGVPSTEFSIAAAFHRALSYDPSSTNKVAPFAFGYQFGVTPFPVRGTNALRTTLKNASINYVGTGAEGGITNDILLWGTTMDARDFTFWYSVDWAAINLDINLANTVINGSNNPINPLYYSQDGINRLQDAAVATLNQAISVGLANGSVKRSQLKGTDFAVALDRGDFDGYMVVNAVPYADYLKANPGDYAIGKYAGLSAIYIPNRGFLSIQFNLNATNFPVQ